MSEQIWGSFREAASRGVRQAMLHSSGHCWDHVEEMLSPWAFVRDPGPKLFVGNGLCKSPLPTTY